MAEFAESRRRLLATAWVASAGLFLATSGVGVGLAADQGIRQTSLPLTVQFLFLRHQPVAAEAGRLCACNPDLAVDNRGARRGRDHSAARDMKSKFCQAIRAAS